MAVACQRPLGVSSLAWGVFIAMFRRTFKQFSLVQHDLLHTFIRNKETFAPFAMDPFCDNTAQLLLPFCLSTSELAELRQVERATRFSCDVRGRLALRRRRAYRLHTLRHRKSDLRRD